MYFYFYCCGFFCNFKKLHGQIQTLHTYKCNPPPGSPYSLPLFQIFLFEKTVKNRRRWRGGKTVFSYSWPPLSFSSMEASPPGQRLSPVAGVRSRTLATQACKRSENSPWRSTTSRRRRVWSSRAWSPARLRWCQAPITGLWSWRRTAAFRTSMKQLFGRNLGWVSETSLPLRACRCLMWEWQMSVVMVYIGILSFKRKSIIRVITAVVIMIYK